MTRSFTPTRLIGVFVLLVTLLCGGVAAVPSANAGAPSGNIVNTGNTWIQVRCIAPNGQPLQYYLQYADNSQSRCAYVYEVHVVEGTWIDCALGAYGTYSTKFGSNPGGWKSWPGTNLIYCRVRH